MSLGSLRRAVAPMLVAVALGSTAGTALTIASPTAALADSTYSMEAQFIAKVNAAREANGQQPYAVASDLTSIARQHSANMAAQQSLYHNPNLTTQVHNWQAVGENVGEGPTVDDIHNAFMNSTEHRDNILDHDFTQIGVGVSVDKNGIIWVTEDFREPMSSGSTTSGGSTASSNSGTRTSAPVTQSTSVAGAVSAPQPRPQLSPRAILMLRIHQLRQHPHVRRTDPVAQSFVYVANLSRLAA